MLFALIGTLISGAFVGWIAGILMHEPGSWMRNIIIGIVGSALGGFLFSLIGFYAHGTIARLIVNVIGACLLIWIVNWLMFHRK